MTSPSPYLGGQPTGSARPQGLGEILERVLDKGVVVAGDIQVNLLDIELLTLKIRLLIASADTAQKLGIDWWQHDPFLSSNADELGDGRAAALDDRVARLEARLAELEPGTEAQPGELPPDAGSEGATGSEP